MADATAASSLSVGKVVGSSANESMAYKSTTAPPKVVVLFGPPGSGKGTQSRILERELSDWSHIDFGQTLRAAVRARTPSGREILDSGLFEAGKVLPPRLVFKILIEAMEQMRRDGKSAFILDGICRTLDAAQYVAEHMRVVCCVNLRISEDEIIERVRGRYIHKASGRTYHVDHNMPEIPGVDDITGEPIQKRANDTPEGIRKRMMVHRNVSAPVLGFFRKRGIPVVDIDATEPIASVTLKIKKVLSACGVSGRVA